MQFVRGKMLSTTCAETDLGEEKAPSSGKKWMTAVVVHMQPIAPYATESPAVNPVLRSFKAIVRDVMADHGALTEALGQATLGSVFHATGDNVQDVWHGIRAAFAVMEKLGDQNRLRSSQNRFPVRVGIGVHSGPTPRGAPTQPLSALAQNLSKAKGLSILNRQTPFPAIFISKNTLTRLDDGRGYLIQPLGEAPLQNLREAMPVYAMMYASQPE